MKWTSSLVVSMVVVSARGDNNNLRRAASSSQCGAEPSTDPCMNDENYKACRDLEDSGCENVAVLEESSCPLVFQCEDTPGKPDACVTLKVFKDEKCLDGPVRTISFPTYTKPGSPCYHDATMDNYSVEDQYCDLETGYWHEMVYLLGTDSCELNWFTKWFSPTEVIFTPYLCIEGFLLESCKKGRCPHYEEDEVEMEDDDDDQVQVIVAMNSS